MAMGMTYEQFWDGDNDMPKMYRKLDEINQERRNEHAWLQGMYFADALFAALSKRHKYPKEPYILREADKKKREERKKKEADAKFHDYMMTMTEHLNRKIAKKRFEKQQAAAQFTAAEKGGKPTLVGAVPPTSVEAGRKAADCEVIADG